MLPQLNHRNYIYELFLLIIEKHRFKAKKKNFVLKYTILYMHCIDILIGIPTKLKISFYDFFIIYYDFLKIQQK